MKLLFFAISFASCLVFLTSARVTRKLYEGDLLLTKHEYKVLKIGPRGQKRGFAPANQWPGGKIPFTLDESLAKSVKAGDSIAGAMKEWMDSSCVKFVPREQEKAYLKIVQDDKERCASTAVGFKGRPYELLLASRCWWHGMVLHELGHVIGFLHEHTRPDRDEYVTVQWQNIKEGRGWDFTRQNNSDPSSFVTPYDYFSIMHYGDGFASKNDEKTLVPKEADVSIGHWEKLSDLDIQQVNLHYNCPAETFVYKKFICQGVKDKIQCYGGRKIEITDAYYGRTEFFKCGVGLTRSCKAKGSQEKIKEACDGKESCELYASNDVYGNPCRFSSKYIEAKYKCTPP